MVDELELIVRVPFFGEQTIHLREESRDCYKILRKLGEIDRLENKVMHLGIIHEIGDVPSFGRWVHIATMLTLIEEIKSRIGSSDLLGFGFTSSVSLQNDVKFSSAEEFLKSWAMLYSIGHLVGTFTSEHALLRSVIPEKEEFIQSLITEIVEIDDPAIESTFREIVGRENIFRIFKLFTTLKIMCKFKENKFIELAKINLLEELYTEGITDLTQRTKIENLLSLFKFIRKLSFTILDGYFSQNCVLLNHYYFLLNIGKILKQKPYDQLLDNLNLFYTQIIYQSPENMFYHHEFAKVIENDVFSSYSGAWDNLVREIIENKIDKKIEEVIQSNKDKVRENRQGHFGRVILKSIDHPVSTEKETFVDISGGIIWNIPAKYYEVDFYLSVSTLSDISKILRAVELVYKRSNDPNKEKMRNFEDIAKNIVINTLKIRVPGYNFICDNRKFGFYSILFDKDGLSDLIKLIDERLKDRQINKGTKEELESSKDLLKEIVDGDENESIFIFSPNVISRKNNEDKAQCDFLLMSYSNSTNNLTIFVSEIKKDYSFGEDQLRKYLRCILGLDESSSESLASKLKELKKLNREIDDKMRLYGDLSGKRALLKLIIQIPDY